MNRHREETLRILTETHAVIDNDHFVYISGDHGAGWIDKDAIYPHTEHIEHLCRDLGEEVRSWGAEAVCGPATGGLIIAEWTAHALGILSLFAEHGPTEEGGALRGRFLLRRGMTRWRPGSACWSWTTSSTRACRCARRQRRCARRAAR